MSHRIVIPATALALVVSVPALARVTARHSARTHHVVLVVQQATISTHGVTATPGYSETDAGVLSGSLGTGASVGTVTFGKNLTFTGVGYDLTPRGALHARVAGRVTLHSDGTATVVGTTTFFGGTGAFAGAKGKTTFTTTRPFAIGAVQSYLERGAIKY